MKKSFILLALLLSMGNLNVYASEQHAEYHDTGQGMVQYKDTYVIAAPKNSYTSSTTYQGLSTAKQLVVIKVDTAVGSDTKYCYRESKTAQVTQVYSLTGHSHSYETMDVEPYRYLLKIK